LKARSAGINWSIDTRLDSSLPSMALDTRFPRGMTI
jgi:hypothetical protein